MAHPVHKLAERRSGASGELVAGVPEIVEVNSRQAGGPKRWVPEAVAKVDVPQGLACRTGEEQTVVARFGRPPKVQLQRSNDDLGNNDDAVASSRLGRTDHLSTAAQRGDLPSNTDC